METSPTSGRKAHPCDVSEREWVELEPLIAAPTSGGRPARYVRREIVTGVCHILRSGSPWWQLPHDVPPWPIVCHYFRRLAKDDEGRVESSEVFITFESRHEAGTCPVGSLPDALTPSSESSDYYSPASLSRRC